MIPSIFVFVALFVGIENCGDFYWRDYEGGVIPSDAILGESSSYTNLYIGQAYIHNYGLVVGMIQPGNTNITVAYNELAVETGVVKILCAQTKSKYYWRSTSSSRYASRISGLCPVKGGYKQTINEDGNLIQGNLIVGRATKYVNNEPRYFVGSISTSDEETLLHYILNDKYQNTTDFYVLLYSDYPLI